MFIDPVLSMPEPYYVRALQPKQAEDYLAMQKLSVQTDPDSFILTVTDYDSMSIKEVKTYLSTTHVIAGYYGPEMVGVVSLCKLPSKLSHMCELSRFYVMPQHRGSGVASEMMQAFLATAKQVGMQGCKISVSGCNQRALRFYVRHGFHEVGRTPGEFMSSVGPVDGVHMLKNLKPTRTILRVLKELTCT